MTYRSLFMSRSAICRGMVALTAGVAISLLGTVGVSAADGAAASSDAGSITFPSSLLPELELRNESVSPVAYYADVLASDGACACGNECGSCDGCCGGNGCCGNCGGGGGLMGLLTSCVQPTDCCYDDFISPMTNFTYFEDPRNLTEARYVFLNHKVPIAAGGGDIELHAVQIRAKLTDRLSFIATKDGFITSTNPLIEDGWADLSAGLKYLLYSDPCKGRLLSIGSTYELPIGTQDALQGNGDGVFHLFTSGGMRLGCRGHWISGTGFLLPTDGSDESNLWYWSNHFDYRVSRHTYVLAEVNWFNYYESGTGGIAGVEGGDLFNFGSTGVTGNDIVTGAFGLKWKPRRHTEVGVAWELPLTDRRDVLENRITVDWILRY